MIRLFLLSIISLLVSFGSVSFSPAEGGDAALSDAQKLERINSIRENGQLRTGSSTDTAPVASSVQVPPALAEQDLTTTGLKMFQGLGLVVGLLLIGAWGYKKYVLKDLPLSSRRIRVLERLMIAPRASLMLVEVENKKILVGTTGQNLSLLDVTNDRQDFVHTLTEELK